MNHDIQSVLDRHNIVLPRSHRIHCPSPGHDDMNPSCAVNLDRGYVYCFACGYNADAAGLEATLTGRPVADILKSWDTGSYYAPREKPESAREMREKLWLDWVVSSQQILTVVYNHLDREGYEDWQKDAASREVDPILDAASALSKPYGDDEALPPNLLRKELALLGEALDRWMDRWMEET